MKFKHQSTLWALALTASLSIVSCKEENYQTADVATAIATPSPESVIEKGKYLVGIMGCNDCHSPKRMGPKGPEIIPELLLSGYPSDRPVAKFESPMIKEGFAMFYPDLTAGAGPWGISFAANLTPDDTGIGSWSETQFKKALKEGKFKGMDNGRMLLPPMPWTNYADLKDEDLHAMFMYLKSIQPVENVVPAPIAPDQM
ncbi:diheme cytochrome c-553 [Mangrovimonas sp. YM274]|uniref:diheme cytochrome c-553 n=1 Tax=Mangrovimonas sp. YM274 TaxID=3070660 RepID=UPI0027DC9D1D|nr:diheme cytochrome c-553 [Mangrovimonas sp. YM274]WMI69049.1 diheme cytochrome c-553 [Mangrovimonas sp. YM274]